MADELSPSQAAARIGATTRSVQRWIAAGRLPARRIGGRWRVAIDVLDAYGRTAPPGADAPRGIAQGTPLRALFIANRGEIARRIARTCERLGIRAVVPPAGGPGAVDLLDRTTLVTAAVAAGADALHPGYGFLAEDPVFAEAVEASGVRWVGPPPAAIRAMGDKAAARRLASSLGVPVVDGYDDPDQSDGALTAAAALIGTPLLVKPTAGGGGKGMHPVRELDRLPDAIATARREALAAFGDDRLILERLLEGPRHVEVQVLFDGTGNGIHLGERECSLQRRHQKILEETPSPAVDEVLRRRLGEEALRLASAVGYRSAGTVEFLVDERGRHHFLEMNTRLQVEHPVTELVTGRDLVADQLRIAAGEPLGLTQADVDEARRHGGHAVEVRLYAEDPEAGFLPATGRVLALSWPGGEGVRVDTGIELGAEVGGRFDPLLAKIVAHGRDRTEAFERLRDALDRTLVLGLITNLRFLRWLVREPVVLAGDARIDTLERIWPPADWAERTRLPDGAWRAAARTLISTGAGAGRVPGADRAAGPWSGGWRLNAPAVVRLTTGDEERTVAVAGPFESAEPFESSEPFQTAVADATVHLDAAGRSIAFRLAPPPDVARAARAAAAHHAGATVGVEAPMPGAVLSVHVIRGEAVEPGDPIVTLEAMKMEHVVPAPGPGTVNEVLVRPADQVSRGQLLAVIEP